MESFWVKNKIVGKKISFVAMQKQINVNLLILTIGNMNILSNDLANKFFKKLYWNADFSGLIVMKD